MSVCLPVALSVCLSARISQKPRVKISSNFCTCYPWPWLGPALTTMQYTSAFVDDVMNSHNRANGLTRRMFRVVGQVAASGRSLPSPNAPSLRFFCRNFYVFFHLVDVIDSFQTAPQNRTLHPMFWLGLCLTILLSLFCIMLDSERALSVGLVFLQS